MAKVGGEDLYRVDEELSPVAEVDEEDLPEEGEEESEEDELNGPECLFRSGEHQPEEDPEEWIDRVADEVEGKRLQKMQVLERPEGSAEGISYLTTRNAYGPRKKPYHHGDGTTSKRWKRGSRLAARELAFAEGKRDDIFSPATSGHVLKLLPAIFLQRVSEEEEAREGEGAFS